MKLNFKLIALALSSTIFFSACSQKSSIDFNKKDLTTINQNDISNINENIEAQKYFKKYFAPWELDKLSTPLKDAKWGHGYRLKKIYLENHILATPEWFDKQIDNSNFEEYNTTIKKAITLKNTNVRVLPTSSVMFYNPNKPGEGFPFDYNQNSLLKINTPVIVSHFSKDRAWAYIQASIVGGWVKVEDIAFVDDEFINKFKNDNYYVAVKEKFPIYDIIFREYVKVGTIFPKDENGYIIAKPDFNQNAKLVHIELTNEVEKMPIAFNKENKVKIAKEMMDEPYGWGGLLNNRDCSSFTQDFFTPFGKYLHRNSKAQTKNGEYLDVSKLSKNEKKEFIKKHGIPFSTLVYLKGHIMLYIGIKEDEPLVMHNMWSVRLKDKWGKKYRHIVGKATITTLEPGKDLKDFDENNNMINRILGIVVL
ncbi:hydrolase Nlp/P60 [Malaciobacter pacificus]|uniref:NlpC/P60 family lipoprotein (SH3b1, SH3b2 type SH3 domains) n=1 Tax=Malaciobacter pacificus TaxID=1080223 RepID=A0A5C2H6P7_9BACT|nr:SH3 domain-containing C40 family peptidase [Malaciobacter pacificus]QEP34493.1 NlpC/P60 family lipoprotein (SH3b1, SH3b2 type SH3 domains) [Malaciobacter pacificus]GGD34080.1 hydrolase Nlp/P60 [Malaciobacter pacificus]